MAKKKNSSNKNLSDHEIKVKLINEASKSLKDYNDLLKETRELEVNRKHQEIQQKKIEAILLANKAKAAGTGLSQTQIDLYKVELAEIEKTIVVGEKYNEIQRQAVTQVNFMALSLKEAGRQVINLGKYIYQQKDYLLEQQKAVKGTELSMGVLCNQAKGFRNNIYKTSLTTTQMGVGTKDLAKLQGTYSDNIGRSVQLSDQQMESMAELAKGTTLGIEGAAEFAGEMEHFNISVKGSAKLVDDMLKTSHKMGVNSGKVIKNVQKNVKLLHKYNFKGGVKGLTKMAALATKFKFEMESIAGFADNLMTPEGAVEAAAKLQVLGGAWAKMGDPFELMYRSRNDMTGLTEDILDATTATARFNKESGEITIDPMELHRLREVAKVTNITVEELSKMAKAKARFNAITTNVSSAFSEEDKKYISGLATWDDKKKEFVITTQVGDETVTESVNALRQITPQIVKSQIDYQQTLKESATQAMTFADRWEGLENMFKSMLLPGFEAFAVALESTIGDFHKWSLESGWVDKLVDLGKTIGEFAGSLVVWAANNPIKAGILALMGSAAVWVARGVQLGMGFNMVANKMGLGGAGGMSKGGMFKNGAFNLGKNGAVPFAKGGGKLGMLGKMGRAGRSGMGVGAGVVGGLASGYDEWSENSAAGMANGENASRTAMRGVGGGLGGWGGAAAGAAIGSVIPVIGTLVGGIIGGALGAWGGSEIGDIAGDMAHGKSGRQLNDFISRDGEQPQPFSKDDTVLGAKKGGPIDNLLNESIPGDNDNSFNTKSILQSNVGKASRGNAIEEGKAVIPSDKKVSVDFKQPLKIEGRLILESNGQEVKLNLDDPILMRDLSKEIQVQLSKAIGGGKNSSNPSV
jgi:hypothetical protein